MQQLVSMYNVDVSHQPNTAPAVLWGVPNHGSAATVTFTQQMPSSFPVCMLDIRVGLRHVGYEGCSECTVQFFAGVKVRDVLHGRELLLQCTDYFRHTCRHAAYPRGLAPGFVWM